jgi:chloramphenicol-sensitive protein RarD
VALAGLGVAWLTWHAGQAPWLALVLAASFALYGLLRKTAALGPLEGLALETLLLAPVGLPLLLWWTWRHGGAGPGRPRHAGLAAAQRAADGRAPAAVCGRRPPLPLATVGMVQYLSPSIQLMLGVWVFHEPFDTQRLLGFVLIWTALALVSIDALRRR